MHYQEKDYKYFKLKIFVSPARNHIEQKACRINYIVPANTYQVLRIQYLFLSFYTALGRNEYFSRYNVPVQH